uniref:cytochrome P450 n=1 Tax=Devosia sp. TaxID=1871048 RepID=UPI002FC608F8
AVIVLILAAYLIPGGQDTAAAGPVLLAAFAAGASCPQVGPLARVRWMALTSRGGRNAGPADLDTALSYESTADELTFVLGPALVGILASLVAPWLPLALAAVLTITLVPAFAVHPTHHAVVRTHARTAAGAAREKQRRASRPAGQRAGAFAAVALPVLAMVCMGTFFGSTQTSLSSFSASFATSELAGLLYAVMGLSSAAAALSVAYWPRRFTANARWLAQGIFTLGTMPDELAAVSANPSAIPATMEEVMRWDSIAQYLERRVKDEPVELGGVTLAPGSLAVLLVGAANRDPARYDAPNEFNTKREQKGHLSFGFGMHHCLGAALARLEVAIAMPRLLKAVPHYVLDGPATYSHPMTRSPDKVGIRLS